MHVPGPRLLLTVAASLLLTACAADDGPAAATSPLPTTTAPTPATVRLLTHDSFNVDPDLLLAFTAETGITIEILRAGDAGSMVNQAILVAGNPQADVLYGVDNTLLSRALEADLFVPHASPALEHIDASLVLEPDNLVTPIDRADVCLNYDRAAFAAAEMEPPATLDDLLDPTYAGMLAVENPATSSTGLAFLLGTIAEQGDGWEQWWADLAANDISVSAGWEDAYYGEFSGSGGSEGSRPLVVSYASSPPAEVYYATETIDEAPTGVIDASCVEQIEFAGILAGTEQEAAARRVVDFLASPEFQAGMPLTMFVFPARTDVSLPDVFVQHTALPVDPIRLDPAEVAENREIWIDAWTRIVLG